MKLIRIDRYQHIVFWCGWGAFTFVLGTVLASGGGMPQKHAYILGAALSGVAQVSVWSAAFSCRTAPLGKMPAWRVLLIHVTTAVILTFFWIKVGGIIAGELDSANGWKGTYNEYTKRTDMLYAAGELYYLLGVAVQYGLIAHKASLEAQERAVESSARAREAELTALKAQINPHFLYNSLNSISALTSIDPARARDMCVSLADFLRLTLGMGEKAVIPLREEVDLLEKYCAIEKVRFGERLTIQKDIEDEAKECLLPPLLLQPLFENAVVHGIAQMPEGGWIRLRAARNGERMLMTVENSWDPEAGSSRKNGVGLKNVQRRLEARYGKEAQLNASAEEEVFRVSLSFPAET
ncbi:MAG: histidine kinase [Candidatus Acidiferrum sp.]|jgi:two-component system sensor histidine kinase AlgZ